MSSRVVQSKPTTIDINHLGDLLIIDVIANQLPTPFSRWLIAEQVGVKDSQQLLICGEIPAGKTLCLKLEPLLPFQSNFTFAGIMSARNSSTKKLTVCIEEPENLKGTLRIEGHDLEVSFVQSSLDHSIAGQIVLSGVNVSQSVPDEKVDESPTADKPIRFTNENGSVKIERIAPPTFPWQQQHRPSNDNERRQPDIKVDGDVHIIGGALTGNIEATGNITIGRTANSAQQHRQSSDRQPGSSRNFAFSSTSSAHQRHPNSAQQHRQSSDRQPGSSRNFAFSSTSSAHQRHPNSAQQHRQSSDRQPRSGGNFAFSTTRIHTTFPPNTPQQGADVEAFIRNIFTNTVFRPS